MMTTVINRTENLIKGINEMVAEHCANISPNIEVPQVVASIGKRYIKLVRTESKYGRNKSAYGFVDMVNGDVLMAAGWSAPAKNGARSNVFDHDFGLSGCNAYSVSYKSGRNW